MSFLIYLTDRKTEKGKKNYAHSISYIAAQLSSEVESITTHNQQSIDLNYCNAVLLKLTVVVVDKIHRSL